MLVRELRPEDCQAVADLEKQLFHGRFDVKTLALMLRKSAFYGVAMPAKEKSSAIRAYCLSYIMSGYADIIAIGTHRDWQRRGYGRFLLKHLIDVIEKRHIEKTLLEVAVDNMAAIQLYQSFGFTEIGRRKNYYQRGETCCDAIIMARARGSAFS